MNYSGKVRSDFMKNNKERATVDLFSDYGLDERERALAANIGFESLKALFNSLIVLTILWAAIYGAEPELDIHFKYVMLSYLAVTVTVRCAYAIKAASLGVINGITAFSYTTGSVPKMIVITLAASALIIFDSKIALDGAFLAFMCVLALVEEAVLYWCGRKNFAVHDSESIEESEE